MKKKILAIFTLIITICSIFALTACGDKTTPAGNGDAGKGDSDFNFSPITSEKLTTEEWTKAFNPSNEKNYSVVFDVNIQNTTINGKAQGKMKRDNDVFYEYRYEYYKDKNMKKSQEEYKYNKNDIWYKGSRSEGTGIETQVKVDEIPYDPTEQGDSHRVGLDMSVFMWLSMATDINQGIRQYRYNFENAKYDESIKQYVITEVGTDINGTNRTIISKIIFKDKKFAQAFVFVDGKEMVRFNATFGGTKISIPDWAMKK